MKALIIYKSVHHKNTEKIAKAIAKALGAELIGPEQFQGAEGFDLVGFGSGIYHSRHHKALFELLDRATGLQGKKVFMFSTAGMVREINHRSLKEKLEEREAVIIGDFSCEGLDSYSFLKYFGGINKGKPNDKDLREAEQFALKVQADAS